MNKEIVAAWEARKGELRKALEVSPPEDYKSLVTSVVTILQNTGVDLDPKRVHQIDDGAYQGTLVFVIAATGYQPRDYWYVKIYYGSCSGCDTLEHIRSLGSGEKPTNEQIDQYMTLALHIVQGLKKMGDHIDTPY